jgi:hypothetical protein
MGQAAMTLERIWLPTSNYSSRGGSAPRLLVLHTTQGASNFYELGAFFAGDVGASSHVGIDDTPGMIGEYVDQQDKAWTQANANPYCLSAELCAWAEWDIDDWDRHPVMLQNTAAWLAEESAVFGIPLTASTDRGVCQHVDLGAAGGGHWDCGPSFPLEQVLAMARGTTPPISRSEHDSMVLTDTGTDGVWVVDATGAVFAYDGAPYLGGCNNAQYNPRGWPCVGIGTYIDERNQDGYVLVLDAAEADEGDRFRRYRFPRDGSAKVD